MILIIYLHFLLSHPLSYLSGLYSYSLVFPSGGGGAGFVCDLSVLSVLHDVEKSGPEYVIHACGAA